MKPSLTTVAGNPVYPILLPIDRLAGCIYPTGLLILLGPPVRASYKRSKGVSGFSTKHQCKITQPMAK
jgi:hypothetical protein